MARRRYALPAAALAVGIGLSVGAALAFGGPPASVRLEVLASGFARPTAMIEAGGRHLVAEKAGTIRVVGQDQPLLDLRALVESAGVEQGLLGIAAHPRYPDDPRIFVDYTDLDGASVVASYRVPPGATAVDAGAGGTLLRVEQPHEWHNGGGLAFGPDGHLYIGLGDGGYGDDPYRHGQNPGTLLGTLLRIDVDRGQPFEVPPDNPFADGTRGAPEVWAYGLRNPWRFSFDRQTDELWIADVGQRDREEVNRAPASVGGLNYGWSDLEGSRCFVPRNDPPRSCDRADTVLPVVEYGHDDGDCAVIGGHVYRGTRHDALRGRYVFGDFCSGRIWAIDAAVPGEPELLIETDLAISALAEDASGEIYVLDLEGSIQRIGPRR